MTRGRGQAACPATQAATPQLDHTDGSRRCCFGIDRAPFLPPNPTRSAQRKITPMTVLYSTTGQPRCTVL
eukprot:3539236-Rhodomonas_salina.1